MIIEMVNYKFEVKRVTHVKAMDTITRCYFVILYLSWNSVTSLVWCHFWLQTLTKKNILAFGIWVTKLPFHQFFWVALIFMNLFLWSNLLHNYQFFVKFHQNLLKKFEAIAYISNWAFFGYSQSCLRFFDMFIYIP